MERWEAEESLALKLWRLTEDLGKTEEDLEPAEVVAGVRLVRLVTDAIFSAGEV